MAKQANDDHIVEKARRIINYWVGHNNSHISENEQWIERLKGSGQDDAAFELRQAVDFLVEANRHIELAGLKLKEEEDMLSVLNMSQGQKDIDTKSTGSKTRYKEENFKFKKIGTIRTPYRDDAPYQPVDEDVGEFKLVLEPRFTEGLFRLSGFRYIYVLYYMHRGIDKVSMKVSPPWTAGEEVGVFASRSPARPNRIGLSVVRVKGIVDNVVFTSSLDVFDMTPLVDIKPYLKDLDAKEDANYGWVEEIDGYDHLLLHIKGIPHDY